jgi:integrase
MQVVRDLLRFEMPAKSMFPSAAIPRAPRNVHDPPGLVVASLLHIRSLKLLYAADREWRGTILVGYFTGARMGNLARLKWKNLDLVERSLTFVQDKTDAKIKVPIHPDLLEYFQSLKMPADRGKPVFPSLCHLPGPGRNELSMRFKRLMKRAGMEDGTAKGTAGKAHQKPRPLQPSRISDYPASIGEGFSPARIARKIIA